MKNIKYFVFLLIAILALSNCSGLYESKKQNKSDEFLVEKKSPLVIPPDYGELPIPKSQSESLITGQNQIKKLIIKNEKKLTQTNKQKKNNSTFEKFIIEKIKKD